jgi:hypothetical protein
MADDDIKDDVQNETPDTSEKLVRLNLKYEFVTNNVKYGPGVVEVNEDVAEDLLRRETEYDLIERERLQSKEIIVDVSAATGTVFSGAGVDVNTL